MFESEFALCVTRNNMCQEFSAYDVISDNLILISEKNTIWASDTGHVQIHDYRDYSFPEMVKIFETYFAKKLIPSGDFYFLAFRKKIICNSTCMFRKCSGFYFWMAYWKTNLLVLFQIFDNSIRSNLKNENTVYRYQLKEAKLQIPNINRSKNITHRDW